MTTLINVCSASFSGSTMLDLMLGNAQDSFSCGEVYAWFRPYRMHHFHINCSCGQSICPIWERLKSVPESKFHTSVIQSLKMKFVIDSSKDLTWVLDNHNWAKSNSIRVFNLLLWKDPIHLAHSYWKRNYNPTAWRNEFINYYGSFIKSGFPFIAVNYNELARDPERKLTEICRMVGMEYFDGRERFWKKNITIFLVVQVFDNR